MHSSARAGDRAATDPGARRFIVGEAGILLTRVEYVKQVGTKWFVIVDGGMSELIRPSHYDSYHAIESRRDAGAPPRRGGGRGRSDLRER